MQLANIGRTYDVLLVSDSFSGTLTASSGFKMDETDDLKVYVPQTEDFIYNVEYREEGQRASSFWNVEKLTERDQYTLFFGGNHADVRIKTDSEGGRVLLILKDSYANCFVPFLIPDFSEIIMIDPRYYLDDIDTVIGAEGVTDVLWLYNATTFATDTSLKRVLA